MSRLHCVGRALLACLGAWPALAWARPTEIVVQPGDALIALAKRYEISTDELRRWNMLDDDTIRVGTTLRLKPPNEEGQLEPIRGLRYEVAEGDTLGAIAHRHGVSVEDLLDFNPGLSPDRIRAGQTLWLGDAHQVVQHKVQPGQTLSAIAAYHHVGVAELVRWNPGLVADRVRAGSTLDVLSRRPRSPSQSVGLPYAGRLEQGACLPRHAGFHVRDRHRAWGTDETVRYLQEGFDHLLTQHPGAPRVEVHDLSLPHGGPIDDHGSHQSGRDVDLAYIARDCGKRPCEFRTLKPSELDVRLQWELLRYWLLRDQVEAVFVDYALQGGLYREARRRGASAEQLGRWLQYPRGRGHPGGTIRHVPKHADHLHVRFACHGSDPDCRAVRVIADRERQRRASR